MSLARLTLKPGCQIVKVAGDRFPRNRSLGIGKEHGQHPLPGRLAAQHFRVHEQVRQSDELCVIVTLT
ncbi:MAG: hypothetical protein ACLQJR_20450 [Stellaceae bacterium]